MNQVPIRKIIIGITIGFVVILLGWLLYRWQFLVIDQTNVGGEVPDSLSSITIDYNYEIDPNQDFHKLVSFDPALESLSFKVEGKRLTILYNYLATKTRYTLKLQNIRALNGKEGSHSLSFTTKYIPNNLLNEAHREQDIEDTNIEQKRYPILADLPYETAQFTIEGEPNIETDSVDFTISLLGILNREEQYPQFIADNKQYKQAALTWLQSKGIDTAKANITYLPSDPDKPEF